MDRILFLTNGINLYTKFLACLLFVSGIVFADPIRPVPWLTEGAIEFLEEYLTQKPSAKILEFGSGASTVWFSKKSVDLYSVEHNPAWHDRISKEIAKNPQCQPIHYYLRQRPYYGICNEFPDEYFDLVVVDGRNRKGCIAHSLSKLKRGGVLMLDNAERRYYFSVFPRMRGWKRFDAQQTKPDSCGFWYRNWLTTWWIKP